MRALWCVAVLIVWVAPGQAQQPGQGVNFYSRDQEVALGRQLAAEFRQGTTPLDNAAANDYVKRVTANLAAQFSGGWTFTLETIREDPHFPDRGAPGGGATREPTAFPGGFIFVSADLIAASRNEAEFAGMLAHAMAHVVARHATRQATRSGLAGASGGPGRGLSVPMGFLAFQRANELEADYLAVKAMASAGYDPAGLASYIERVQPAPGRNEGFETLPPRARRVAAIQAEIRKLPAASYQASDEFARVQAEVKDPGRPH